MFRSAVLLGWASAGALDLASLGQDTNASGGCCKGPTAAEVAPGLGDTPYVFAGFGSASKARELCGMYGGLPMPSTERDQRLLQDAVKTAAASGKLSHRWPQNTIWLGGQWHAASGRWEWDDGVALSSNESASHHLATVASSSESKQHTEAWLCMVLDGTWQDSLPSHDFGIICKREDPEYDCTAGAENREKGWSDSKKAWCCEKKNVGCRFNCHNGIKHWRNGWSDDKKEWCCENKDVGCPFDCRVGAGNWKNGWSDAKKEWCCKNKGSGCPFDCQAAKANWESAWSDTKKDWCCKHESLGCSFDCDSNSMSQWSTAHAMWCCQNKKLGCPTSSTGTTTTATLQVRVLILNDTSTRPQNATSNTTTAPKTTTEAPETTTEASRVTSTETDTQVSVIDASAAAAAEGCFEDRITWEPLHMPNVTQPITVPNASSCQEQCVHTPGCAHFSFWAWGAHCYLQDQWAIRQTGRLGFVSGPFRCWEDLDHGKYTRIGNQTFMNNAFKCVELGTIYSPILGIPKVLSNASTGKQAAKQCKKLCESTEGCEYWTMHFPARMCRLAGAGAHPIRDMINSVSGVMACSKRKQAAKRPKAADVNAGLLVAADVPRRIAGAGPAFLIAGCGAVLAAGAAAAGVMMIRRRSTLARSSRTLQTGQTGAEPDPVDEALLPSPSAE